MNNQQAIDGAGYPDDEKDIRCTEDILAYSWESYSRHIDNFDKLDSKAATLAGFIGVVLALAATKTDSLADFPISSYVSAGAFSLYTLLLPLLAVSFFFCMLVLRARRIENPTTIEDMIAHYRSLGPLDTRRRRLLKDMVKTISVAENSFRRNNVNKSRHLEHATLVLLLSLVTAVCAYVLTIADRIMPV